MRIATSMRTTGRRWTRLPLGLLIAALLASAAWGQTLPNEYGGWSGRTSRRSLNGFSAFSELLRDRGHTVRTWRQLTPTIESYDTIIWIPAGDRQITGDESDRIARWLDDGYERTLILVLKDYDATRDYLEDVMPQTQGTQAQRYRREWELIVARDQTSPDVAGIGDGVEFADPGPVQGRTVASRLSGPWAQQVSGPTRIVTRRTLKLPLNPTSGSPTTSLLLGADGKPFVYEIRNYSRYPNSRVIVVANGSFLVNYGFTREGNRELANLLADEIPYDEPVLFLESGEQEMSVSDEEPELPTFWDWMKTWPLSFLFPHLILVGVLTYFVYVPLFGRPRRLPPPSRSDLGQHVDSVAALLQRDGDHERATRILNHYREQVRQDSRGLGVASGRRRKS